MGFIVFMRHSAFMLFTLQTNMVLFKGYYKAAEFEMKAYGEGIRLLITSMNFICA
jgi:hypothetical protein